MNWDLYVGIALATVGFITSAILVRRDIVRRRRDDWIRS